MISDKTVDAVRDADIVSVLRPYMPDMHRKGSRFFACCPLHGEHTPSLAISPDKGLWHCFGCHAGGDAISFIQHKEHLSFEEAVVSVAQSQNIPVEYLSREQSDEQKKEAAHREALFELVAVCQNHFVKALEADSVPAKAARDYAYSRWSRDFAAEAGIGYAPQSQAFMDFVNSYDLPKDDLIELGILRRDRQSGNLYFLFAGRLTIPIRNRTGRIVGFTARKLDDSRPGGKYINSSDSPVFHKSDLLFGINRAVKAARKADYVIVVEGAPDVMRLQSIGIDNAVAPLGTALTQSQLEQLRKYTDAVCFIPDSDPQKDPDTLPPGIAAVARGGALAVKAGFFVTVCEIPQSPDGEKQDADSFISSRDDFFAIEEQPFIPWLAEKRFAMARRLASRQKVIAEIADILAACPQDRLDQTCRDLAKVDGSVSLWKKAAAQAKGLQARKEGQPTQEELDAKTRPHGFVIRNNSYYSIDENDNEIRLSNFILIPHFHLIKPEDSIRIFTIRNEEGQESTLVLKQSDFFAIQSFCTRVTSLGSYIWLAKSDKLSKILWYCFQNTRSAFPVNALGWSAEHRLYAFGNGIYLDGSFHPVDDMGIVSPDGKRNFFIPATSDLYKSDPMAYQFERSFICTPESPGALSMHGFVSGITESFGDAGAIAFSYLLAACFRDVCYPLNQGAFPILNLFGEKGTGKSTLASLLQTVFMRFCKPPSLDALTIPAFNDLMTQSVNYLNVVDEYKNDVHPSKINFLKTVFDGAGQSKKNMDGDKRIFRSVVTSSLAICGQDKPTQDMALFSRLIFIHLTRTQFSEEQLCRLNDFVARCAKGNIHLLLRILDCRKDFEARFPDAFERARKDLSELAGRGVVARVLNSWSICMAALAVMQDLIDIPISYEALLPVAAGFLIRQNEDLDQNSEMSDFWNVFQGLYSQGRIVDTAHFRIKELRSFTPIGKAADAVSFAKPRKLLFLNPAAIQLLFSKGPSASPTANKSNWPTLLSYLKAQPYFLGLKQDRFYLLKQSGEFDVTWEGSGPAARKLMKSVRPKALCFDYEVLRDRYGLALESELVFESALSGPVADDDDSVFFRQ
ncbi:MAG: DNA primase [Muribaculaceae bacterium]|nr:DNA primase [Muribaculaceae bacterium]